MNNKKKIIFNFINSGCLLWISSPLIALPFTIVLILIVLSYMFGGKNLIETLVARGKQALSNVVSGATTAVASNLLKKD